jgi:mannose-1-phosphate guanylyltransferase
MFEHTIDRIAPVFQPEQIIVVAGSEHMPDLADQAPELPIENLLSEPVGRGTAPAIGLGAIHLRWHDPDAVIAVLTADHFITNVERFRGALGAAAEVAEAGYLVTLGIEPASPSTGYGYIHQGEKLDQIDGFDVFHVQRFTEKPSRETALHMVESGEYTWNSGMFIWRVDRIMEEFRTQMPDFYVKLAEVEAALGTRGFEPTLDRVWPQVAKQAIDYGVMEGAEDVAVIPVDIGWSDVGSWASLAELLAQVGNQDDSGNVVVGQHAGIDTTESLIFGGERLIATIGLEGLIVVDAGDAILVCPIDREQDVRDMVRHLQQRALEAYL